MEAKVDFIPLRNLSMRITKGTTPTRGEGFVSRGINYVKSEAITPNGTIDTSKFAQIDEATHKALARSQLSVGNVLFSMAGVYLGKTAVVKPEHLPANTNQAVGIIAIDEAKADPRFIHYSIQAPSCRSWIMNSAAQSAQPNFNLKEIGDLPIPHFELEEQRAIAHALGTLDDKIELNRHRNQTLEAMARALFKDWFIDFGPVRAKMEGQQPYLPADLWQLFPDRLDDEGKPEGWEMQPLDEIADFLNGLALQKFPATDPDDSLPVIKIAELRNGVSAKSDRASREVPTKYIVNDGDFLFSWSGSLLAKFWTEGEGALNQHLFKVTSEHYPMWFVAHWVHHHLEEFQAIAASKATTMGHIQRGHLKAAVTLCPPDDVMERLGVVMAPLVEQAIHNELESRHLAQLRDTLLPKLISGELRIADADKFMESVTL
jgi:type I restriction enzyme S subunit